MSNSSIKETARFVRLKSGDVYRRTEMLEQASGAVLIGDEEARAFFSAAGGDLKKLGLDEDKEPEAKVAKTEKPKKPGRKPAAKKEEEPASEPEADAEDEPKSGPAVAMASTEAEAEAEIAEMLKGFEK